MALRKKWNNLSEEDREPYTNKAQELLNKKLLSSLTRLRPPRPPTTVWQFYASRFLKKKDSDIPATKRLARAGESWRQLDDSAKAKLEVKWMRERERAQARYAAFLAGLAPGLQALEIEKTTKKKKSKRNKNMEKPTKKKKSTSAKPEENNDEISPSENLNNNEEWDVDLHEEKTILAYDHDESDDGKHEDIPSREPSLQEDKIIHDFERFDHEAAEEHVEKTPSKKHRKKSVHLAFEEEFEVSKRDPDLLEEVTKYDFENWQPDVKVEISPRTVKPKKKKAEIPPSENYHYKQEWDLHEEKIIPDYDHNEWNNAIDEDIPLSQQEDKFIHDFERFEHAAAEEKSPSKKHRRKSFHLTQEELELSKREPDSQEENFNSDFENIKPDIKEPFHTSPRKKHRKKNIKLEQEELQYDKRYEDLHAVKIKQDSDSEIKFSTVTHRIKRHTSDTEMESESNREDRESSQERKAIDEITQVVAESPRKKHKKSSRKNVENAKINTTIDEELTRKPSKHELPEEQEAVSPRKKSRKSISNDNESEETYLDDRKTVEDIVPAVINEAETPRKKNKKSIIFQSHLDQTSEKGRKKSLSGGSISDTQPPSEAVVDLPKKKSLSGGIFSAQQSPTEAAVELPKKKDKKSSKNRDKEQETTVDEPQEKVEEPKSPPRNAQALFMLTYGSKMAADEAKKVWKEMEPIQKKRYTSALDKVRQTYKDKVASYLKSLSKEELQAKLLREQQSK